MKHIIQSIIYYTLLILSLFVLIPDVQAQDKCGSMELLDQRFSTNPGLKLQFDSEELRMQQLINQKLRSGKSLRTSAGEVSIPVVFHIVLRNQSLVTEEQILAQLDTINKDYAGAASRLAGVPSHFRQLFGSSAIRFCMAQRTPDDKPTTGIVRYSTTRSSFDYTSNYVKHASTGGADSWDTERYLNIWICDLSNSTLGYATFPGDGVPGEQGVAVDYSSLPGGSAMNFNGGKTLTHEVGHFFNLYHIWGDDNGSCSGSDRVDDTPNQANSTTNCRTGIVTDNCSPSSPGIMYQNYMDYTPDFCLFMFTNMQVARMEEALLTYRASLTTSNGCIPLDLKSKDASLRSVTNPDQRICANSFVPQVVLRNRGSETLRSVNIHAVIDDGTVQTYAWTGSLATYADVSVTLPQMSTGEGNHILNVYTSNPNGAADEDTSNDQASLAFIYYKPVDPPVTESFEGEFPPRGWDIVNEDGFGGWEKVGSAAKTGNNSARIINFGNEDVGQRDYLRLPTVNISSADSAFVSFQVAAATYTSTSVQSNVWDTLQVLISTDCGQTYQSVYKKWGSTLITRSGATRTVFTPTAAEWRKEEVNISDYIGQGNVMIAFLNSNGNENAIYLDDIHVRTVVINPNLKEAGFLVSPNPTSGQVSVQFYPHPVELSTVAIYNAAGQKVMETLISGEVSTNIYNFNLTHLPAGLYVVRAQLGDQVLTKKIIKQ